MAFFNFRKQVDSHDASPDRHEAVESVETLRKKALHRLIGSAILVVIGVVVFSLVFDRQPRPIPVDIAIQIPAKEGQPPLVIGVASQAAQVAAPETSSAAASATVAAPVAASATAAVPASVAPVVPVTPKASLAPKEELVTASSKPAPTSKPVAVAPQDTKDNAKVAEAQKVKDLLDGKPPTAVASAPVATGERFIVQVGAFADAAKARQARLKVENAGLKTYTQVAETAEGKRIRVRVGPFGSRDEAEKAAKKIKSLDLAANILTL
jgi:DedD protein